MGNEVEAAYTIQGLHTVFTPADTEIGTLGDGEFKEEVLEEFTDIVGFQFGSNIVQITHTDGSSTVMPINTYSRIRIIPHENPFTKAENES